MWRQLLCQRRHVLQFFLRMFNPRIPFNFEFGLNPFLSRFPQALKSEKIPEQILSFSSLHLITSVKPDEGQKRTFSLDCFQSYGNNDDIHPLAEIPDPELFLGPRPARPPNSGQILHSRNPRTCWSTRTEGTSTRRHELHSLWTFAQLGPRPRCADVTTGQIWKSLHIVAATATAVLTREREISTCLQHIPAPALHNTWLLCELPTAEPRALGEDPFRCFVREDRWLRSGFTIQTKCEAEGGIPGI